METKKSFLFTENSKMNRQESNQISFKCKEIDSTKSNKKYIVPRTSKIGDLQMSEAEQLKLYKSSTRGLDKNPDISREKSSKKSSLFASRRRLDSRFGGGCFLVGGSSKEEEKQQWERPPMADNVSKKRRISKPHEPEIKKNAEWAIKDRENVQEVLDLFRKMMSEKQKKEGKYRARMDMLVARDLRNQGKSLILGREKIGAIPGIEIGDTFFYRVELSIVGLHRPYEHGVNFIKDTDNGRLLATSVIASEKHDDLSDPNTICYTGQGGNIMSRTKKTTAPEDQKMKGANLALKNCIGCNSVVRVIRSQKSKLSFTMNSSGTLYTYDGLYTVDSYRVVLSKYGKTVFKFLLKKVAGQ
ncbi:SRA-YDG [Dillenia turbinata]|uniref:SRA-YDG n=1 Tax=Dillenia turbinata TaxID=194707 RepID=A0AAN8WFN6_9MAGN